MSEGINLSQMHFFLHYVIVCFQSSDYPNFFQIHFFIPNVHVGLLVPIQYPFIHFLYKTNTQFFYT